MFFFLSGFFFTDTGDSQDRKRRKWVIFYSTLPLPLAHKHSDICLQLRLCDESHEVINYMMFNRYAPDLNTY